MFGKRRKSKGEAVPAVGSGASNADIDAVVEKLSLFQSLCTGQRIGTTPMPQGLADIVIEKAQAAGIDLENATTRRDLDIAELMAAYGDAVRRVPGADPQDLLILRELGLIKAPESS